MLNNKTQNKKHEPPTDILGLPNILVYNNIFRLTIMEDDGLFGKTKYINEDFNFNTFNFNTLREINADGGVFYYEIQKKQFPVTSF